jgi:capsid portal protein
MSDVQSRAVVLKGKVTSDPYIVEFGTERYRTKYAAEKKIFDAYKEECEGLTEKSLIDVRNGLTSLSSGISLGNIALPFQIEEACYGEYIKKPYDEEKLSDLTELCGRLRSCITSVTKCSVGLGLAIVVYGYPNLRKSDLTEQEEITFKDQRKKLILWTESKVVGTKDFGTICEDMERKKLGMGNSYLEVVYDAKDEKIVSIDTVDPRLMWVGRDKDRYIQMSKGLKTYFRPFYEKEPVVRSSVNFSAASPTNIIPPEKQATRIVHYKNFNLISEAYGIPDWTPVIPDILGDRAASERNKVFFDSDAVPRLAITVSGGSLTPNTIDTMEDFFTQTQGFQQAHRVLIIECSSTNVNSPDWKPATIEIVPLTVGQTDDASFLNYSANVNERVRETFRVASIFLGNSEDVNRAAAFTMREMTVNLTFIPEGMELARLFNKTLLRAWMKEEGLTEETCVVQYGFEVPSTMSQKDKSSMYRELAAAGALSPNDIRIELGYDLWDTPWASVPTALAIVMMQMSLINAPDKAALTGDVDTSSSSIPSGNATKSMHTIMRGFLHDLEVAFKDGNVAAQEALKQQLSQLYREPYESRPDE